MNIKTGIEVAKGIATNIPILRKLAIRSTGGSVSARYCYSVWMRHLVMAHKNGLHTNPEIVAELGPGDSLGMGIAALLTGAGKYFAFDVVRYANNDRNISIFEELVSLFMKRDKIPEEDEFPGIKPDLESYEFPNHILSENLMHHMLSSDRLYAIRNALTHPGMANEDGIEISYIVPWDDLNIIKNDSVDMIFSQAVLEHVNDLAMAYNAQNNWLKPGGYISHQIDFASHGTASEWNGHWAYSGGLWKIILGKRPYPLNRACHSYHLDYLNKLGFSIVCDKTDYDSSGVPRRRLAPEFENITDDDLHTSGAFIQAVKSA